MEMMNAYKILNKKCLLMNEEQIIKDWDGNTEYVDQESELFYFNVDLIKE